MEHSQKWTVHYIFYTAILHTSENLVIMFLTILFLMPLFVPLTHDSSMPLMEKPVLTFSEIFDLKVPMKQKIFQHNLKKKTFEIHNSKI